MFGTTPIAAPARRAGGIGRFAEPCGLGRAAFGAITMFGALQFREKHLGAPICCPAAEQTIQFTARAPRQPSRQRDLRHQ